MKTNFFLFITILFIISVFPSCSTNDEEEETTVTDFDGNEYNIVEIGNQFWLVENLKTSHYRNGDPIPTGLDSNTWANTTSGAYVIYDNDPQNDAIYGKLYNWYTVNDSRGICPQGWHIPSRPEWEIMLNLLGGEAVAGGFLKSTSYWNSPNTGANNETGFTALPGGYGSPSGSGGMGEIGLYWSSTEHSSEQGYYLKMYYNYQSAYLDYDEKKGAKSCRCLKD